MPKKGDGMVLNSGPPVGWWIVVSKTVIPLAIVAAVTIAVSI